MEQWHQTGCVLCSQNCGLRLLVEDNMITKVKADKENPRSQGYICRKGTAIKHYQHHAQRLTHPLKKQGDGFARISWEQAISEISEKLKTILDRHGKKSFAYMGGGGQGCHLESGFGKPFMDALGCQYVYSALAQEHTGMFWGWGRLFGDQALIPKADIENTEMLVVIGWNGMKSHGIPNAPQKLKKLAEDDSKKLVVIDPRRSKTASMADIHFPIRPGCDALLARAIISILFSKDLVNTTYLKQHTKDWEQIKNWTKDFDIDAAINTCELNKEEVFHFCELLAHSKWSLKMDLGVFMNRHSTVASYLWMVILGLCGRLCQKGGNVIPGDVAPLGSHTDEKDEKYWRTQTTDFFMIRGLYPPNVMPEEILSQHPERLRAVWVSNANPLRSYADTQAYEKAFKSLDLLVTVDPAMTETAMLSDYILPAKSGYESWDTTFFANTYPEVYFQLRRPVVQPMGESLEPGEIITRLADAMGLIPEIPEKLFHAAKADRSAYLLELMSFLQTEPKALSSIRFILAKTLGQAMGSAHLALVWGMFQLFPAETREIIERAGFPLGPNLGEELFKKAMDHPEGFWIGKSNPEANMENIKNEDGKIHLYIHDLEDWIQSITPENENNDLKTDPKFPFILNAGRHSEYVANTNMRDPAWNKGKRACTLAMNPEDAKQLGLNNGEMVQVATEAGNATIELETTEKTRPGMVIIPHGFGLDYNGQVYGVNINQLTKNTHRDRLAGTPLHRFVRCDVTPITQK